jgi:hypothetical protein
LGLGRGWELWRGWRTRPSSSYQLLAVNLMVFFDLVRRMSL